MSFCAPFALLATNSANKSWPPGFNNAHMPINKVQRMLSLRPAIKGISLPSMPGPKEEPITVFEIKDSEPRVFAVQ